MKMRTYFPLAAAAILLGACEARFGNDAGEVAENATAEGRAEQGRLTVEAPGFNLSVQIPEGIRSNAGIDEDNGLIYPGAEFGGIHVQGGRDEGAADSGGEVELRFSTADPVDRVTAWYRDPARNRDFTIRSDRAEESGVRIEGVGREERQSFAVRIGPRAGGGTEARLILSDRNQPNP